MCGIAGEIRLDGGEPDADAVAQMVLRLTHRGPDEDGHFTDGPIAMGMRRLSIVGLSTGKQPLMSADGHLALIFNGEIYNYPALKAQFEKEGRRFLSGSDGEAILALYERDGLEALRHLNGMFALALYDKRHGRLVLARDAMGIKPLFLQEIPGGLLFASEIKAILEHPSGNPALRPAGMVDYLCLSYSPLEKSLFQHIQRLLPGQALIVEEGKTRKEFFYTLGPSFRSHAAPVEPLATRLRKRLEEAVSLELLADVPVGAFLSGGIDSSAVVALMRPHVKDLVTFSMGFKGSPADMDEREKAWETAKFLKTEHVDIVLDPEEIPASFDEALRYFDEPFGGGLHTWFLSREAAKTHKVVLTGIGADELLGGYNRNLRLGKLSPFNALPGGLRKRLAALAGGFLEKLKPGSDAPRRLERLVAANPEDRYFQWISLFGEQELRRLVQPEFFKAWELRGLTERAHQALEDPALPDLPDEVSWLETRTTLVEDFLAYTDRTTMAFHLEARVPFLNRVVVEEVLSWPWRMRFTEKPKGLLYEAVADLLPPGFGLRKKQPFLMPLTQWLRGPLQPFVTGTLLRPGSASAWFLRPEGVKELCLRFFAGEDRAWQVWHLMGIERFLRLQQQEGGA